MKIAATTPRRIGPVRVVIYSRVSTDEQVANGVSIDQQPILVRRELDSRFGPGNYIVVAEHSDRGMSGSFGPTVMDRRFNAKKVRPGLSEVFRLVEEGAVDVVAVQDVSRLYRDQAAMFGFLDVLLLPNGVDLVSVAERIDIHTPAGRMQAAVLGAAAAYQRSSNNEKIASFLGQRRREGLWQGAAPYGWRFSSASEIESGARKTLVPIPEQLVGVKRAAELYLSGQSLRNVAGILNREGIMWIRNHQRAGGRREEPWTDTRVKLVLRCWAQAGLVKTPEGELIEGVHAPDAPITREQFEQIGSAMDERRTRFRGVRTDKPDFVLSGIPRCECCGGKLMAKRMEGGSYAHMCPARRLVCEEEHPPIWARTELLEQLVVSEIGRVAISPEVLDEARRLVHQKAAEGSDSELAELDALRKRLDSFAESKRRASSKLIDGIMDDDAYQSFLGDLREQEAGVLERVNQLEESLQASSNKEATLRKALDALTAFPKCWNHLEPCEKAELLRATIESLTVGSDASGTYVQLKLRNFEGVVKRLPRDAAGPMVRGSGPDSLTYAEWSVLYYFAIGKTNTEIALMTGRTKSTISTICRRILERLDVPDMKRAVKAAGKLAIEFAETYDMEILRKKRRRPKHALTPMEEMAINLKRNGHTSKEMASRGISSERSDKLLRSAEAKLALQRGELA